MSDARQAILSRIRQALATPTAASVRRHGESELPVVAAESSPRAWLPRVPQSYPEQASMFAACSERLRTTFIRTPTAESASAELRRIAAAEEWKRIAFHRQPLVTAAIEACGLPSLATDGGYDMAELEQCNAGVTACDAIVAQTGSVVVTSRSAGGRALSVLPPHHVVLATRDQLLPDLPAAFELLQTRYADDWPSFLSLITGPSRTGDIERIVVLGAHGPRKLTIILVESDERSSDA